MKERMILVHRWGGTPNSDWYPWIRRMLLERDFEVLVPEMPHTNEPHIGEWVPYLSEVAKGIDENTYFIGHSVGCQAIMRYLEELGGDVAVGAVFIAPWLNLIGSSLESNEEKELAMEWTSTPIDLHAVKRHLKSSFALFSDNDPFVPLDDSRIFREELGSRVVIHPKRGHFTEDDGVLELHAAFNEIMKMAK
ncbi:MAG: alpha/beta hydrolase [Candidatus Micrarchaeota archaeon]|nr:alpha/beta hydrolase [Candidatus Micrarchaeota archaeon]